MDINAPQNGDSGVFGIERISYSVPDSFFPLKDANTTSTTTNSTNHSAQKWSCHFEGPRIQTQLRAWSRIEWPSLVARNFSGIIMKRVGFPLPCDTNAPTITQPVLPETIDIPLLAEDGLPARRVRRRLNSYKWSLEECRLTGKPLSSLEMTGIKMRALADVAHCLGIYATCTTRAETQQRRAGHYVQTIPLKRRLGTVPSAGNKLRTYTEISQLPKVSPHFRVPARRFSVLPRSPASSPALSPIALFTPHQEPVTPAAIIEPPPCMSDAKSPTKRSPRHKSPPIKNEGPRISEPAVKLLPATTPKFEPSPIKPASPPPATPLSENRSLRGSLATPLTFPKAAPFGTAFAGMQRPSALRRASAASSRFSPTKLLATPCPAYHNIEPSSQPSPAKPMLSVTETPRRPVAAEPMTPRIFSDSYITADVPSPITFVSKLFPASPAKQSVQFEPGTPQKPANFDFGTASPAFNSVTWLNDIEVPPRSVTCLKKGSRRQSEPLLRGCLKAQNRRQTMSPQKLVFKAGQTFSPSKGSPVNRRQTISHVKLIPEIERALAGSSGLFSPLKKAAQPAPSTAVKSTSPRLARSQKPRRSFDKKSPIGRRRSANEVVNIDMRQNSDIFGTMAVSYGMSPVLGTVLPRIVESGSEVEGHNEPAEPQPSSPSVEIESREGVEKKHCAQTPAEVNGPAAQDASVSNVVNSPVVTLCISESLPVDSPLVSIEEHKEVTDAEPSVIAQSPSPVTFAATSVSPKEQKLSPSPTLNLSFTPVNGRSLNAVEATVQVEEIIPESPLAVTIEIAETSTAQSHDYDSPGRDYMREFIRRSRPKRPSTTEAGSPVSLQVKRQPLGPKSPNTESPTKKKRKFEKDHDQHESPLKKTSAASPKKIRRSAKNSVNKAPRAEGDEEEQAETLDVQPTTESAIADEEDDTGSDSTSRRSSRLRDQTRLPPARSAIPTPIKIGRTRAPPLNSAVRSVQQDLTNQTRMNTRRNKGNAEYPAQFLAKQSEEAEVVPQLEPAERESSSEKEGRKCVNWRNPLALYQEDDRKEEKEKEQPKKAKPSKPKTVQMSGIAKPVTRAKTTADKARTARLAEHFGMVSNGTPAKPQRSTRSRMRI